MPEIKVAEVIKFFAKPSVAALLVTDGRSRSATRSASRVTPPISRWWWTRCRSTTSR